jgi:hypothetical protein
MNKLLVRGAVMASAVGTRRGAVPEAASRAGDAAGGAGAPAVPRLPAAGD